MFKALGKKVTEFQGLETFPAPEACDIVVMTSDEVSSICPVTGQPDLYTVEIRYEPGKLCLESKSLKMYLQSFRNVGVFCEALSEKIAWDVYEALYPWKVSVTVTQKARGGISISARSQFRLPDLPKAAQSQE